MKASESSLVKWKLRSPSQWGKSWTFEAQIWSNADVLDRMPNLEGDTQGRWGMGVLLLILARELRKGVLLVQVTAFSFLTSNGKLGAIPTGVQFSFSATPGAVIGDTTTSTEAVRST